MTDYNAPDDPCDEEKPKPPNPTPPPKPTPPNPPPPEPPPCEPEYPKEPCYKPKDDGCVPDCCCPPGPTQTDSCLEKLIDKQTKPITDGVRAKDFKDELEKFLTKARAAKDEYTQEKYKDLVKLWEDEDAALVDLTAKVECTLKCWRCVIECHVCPLLYQMRKAEQELYGDGTWCDQVHDLQDLLYWRTRDKDAKERFFNRIKAILAAWEKPAPTLAKILDDNVKKISDAKKALCTDPSTALYDIFLKLIPVHFAIKPPNSKSNIDDRFRKFCCCDKGKPIPCCDGRIDIGEPTLRRRLVGWLPYLIDPNAYFDLICCLVSRTYMPAKDKLSAAEAAVTSAQNDIKRNKELIENGLKNFEKNAKAAIPVTIDCNNYYPKKDKGKDQDKDPCKGQDKDQDKDQDNGNDSSSPR